MIGNLPHGDLLVFFLIAVSLYFLVLAVSIFVPRNAFATKFSIASLFASRAFACIPIMICLVSIDMVSLAYSLSHYSIAVWGSSEFTSVVEELTLFCILHLLLLAAFSIYCYRAYVDEIRDAECVFNREFACANDGRQLTLSEGNDFRRCLHREASRKTFAKRVITSGLAIFVAFVSFWGLSAWVFH